MEAHFKRKVNRRVLPGQEVMATALPALGLLRSCGSDAVPSLAPVVCGSARGDGGDCAAITVIASTFRIDSRTGIGRHAGVRCVRASVGIGRWALVRHRARSVAAVRTHPRTFEGDDAVSIEKAEKQRETDGEHDVSPYVE